MFFESITLSPEAERKLADLEREGEFDPLFPYEEADDVPPAFLRRDFEPLDDGG